MNKTKTSFIIVFILSIASVSNAVNIVYVDVNGPNDPGSGSYTNPFRRIQDAINAAQAGDRIEIRPGVYTGVGNYDLDPNGKSITVRSINPEDAGVVANTIIDPNKAGRGFRFVNGEDPNCAISGLTIRNGLAADDSGGAILCYNSNPTISNCVIKNNTADWYGGALFCDSGSPEITGCTITGNSAIDGGALECWSGTTIIRNCIISNNTASNNGGAIDCYWEGQAKLHSCAVVANSAGIGGALHCIDDGEATIENGIIWSNRAAKGAQIAVESSPFNTSEVTISYSDVQGGISAVHTDPCSILSWGSGNIGADPCFASFDPNGNPNLWDFHLKSAYGRWNSVFYRIDLNNDGVINLLDFARLAGVWLEQGSMPEDLDSSGTVDCADLELFTQYFLTNSYEYGWVSDTSTSPCVDAGDPNSDWANEPWPNGKRINMGAYGGTHQASKSGNPMDFNVDGLVNFVDFAEFASHWLATENCIEDLNLNGFVELGDLHIFTENWLWEK
jgi:hypothetical protein